MFFTKCHLFVYNEVFLEKIIGRGLVMNENQKKILKNAGLLLVFICICALLVRHFSGTETLEEYAKKNPSKEEFTVDSSGSPGNKEDEVKTGELPETTPIPSERITYQEGFFYEPLSQEIIDKITGCSYPAMENGKTIEIDYSDLSYVSVKYVNFHTEICVGKLICNKVIAQDLVEIFYELYRNDYQIEQIALIEEYNGDDLASCSANNTSCFNYREVVGSTSLSKHALGLAIDINPFYNPYITYNKDGSENIYPKEAAEYADRSKSFPYKIDENDLCYKLFTEHGFSWGGNWNSCKDYQHFQKNPTNS